MAFNFDFLDFRFQQLKVELERYLRQLYNRSGDNFTPASPHGHILQAMEYIFQISTSYLKNTINQFDLSQPDNLNPRTIRTLARIAGHDPFRSLSASGTLRLQVRPQLDISAEIAGAKMTIINRTRLRNRSNNLDYFIDVGTDFETYNLQAGSDIFLPIVQGRIESQTFTSDGTKNQSFSVNIPAGQSVEQFRIRVLVGGQLWTRRDHLFDMLPDEMSYFSRTGFTGGIEIWFGNDNFGQIPSIGTEIRVEYVISDGIRGNINNKLPNDFTFLDEVYDGQGNLLEIEDLFFVFIADDVSFGTDPETTRFTKAVLPYLSRNFVLARPEQYIFQLKRLGMFSQVDAYTTEKGTEFDDGNPDDDSTVYLFLVPDFRNFLGTGSMNYFQLSESAFTLDDNEKSKIRLYLNSQGTVAIGTSLQIVDAELSRYILNVRIRIFANFTFKNVRLSILDALSDYFIANKRRDRIPRSDLIRVIEDVAGVDSVDVQILGQLNETYHKEYEDFKKSILEANPTVDPNSIVLPGYDPDRVIGLDEDLGDILIDKDQLAIIKGGWQDRFGTRYDVNPKEQGLGSVNISLIGTVNQTIDV